MEKELESRVLHLSSVSSTRQIDDFGQASLNLGKCLSCFLRGFVDVTLVKLHFPSRLLFLVYKIFFSLKLEK